MVVTVPLASARRASSAQLPERGPQKSRAVAARNTKVASSPGRSRAQAKAAPLSALAHGVAVVPSDLLRQFREEEVSKAAQPSSQPPQRETKASQEWPGVPSSRPRPHGALASASRHYALAPACPDSPEALHGGQQAQMKDAEADTNVQSPAPVAYAGAAIEPRGMAQQAAIGACDGYSSPNVSPSARLASASASVAAQSPADAVESPSAFGRRDVFGNDRDAAERDRERRRLQAQMLAEQVEEQRKKKEEEKRRIAEEERLDELRLEREREEIQRQRDEREARDRERANGITAANAAVVAAAQSVSSPVEAEAQSAPTRRPRVSPGMNESPSGTAFQWTTSPLGAPSDMSHMSPEQRDRAQRRRRRRRSDATWRSPDRSRRTWDDDFSLRNPDTRSSPTPWHCSGLQAVGDPSGTVGEDSKEMRDTIEARRTRRTRRRRLASKERAERDRDRERDQERERNRSSGELPPTRGEGTNAWAASQEELSEQRASTRPPHPPARRRARSGSGSRFEQQTLVSESSGTAAKLSDDSLREQLGSVLRICEQLLRERVGQQKDQQTVHGDAVGSPVGGMDERARRTPSTGALRSARRQLSLPSLGESKSPASPQLLDPGKPASLELHGVLARDPVQSLSSPPIQFACALDAGRQLGSGEGLDGVDLAGVYGGQIYESHSQLLAADIDDAWPPDALADMFADATKVDEGAVGDCGRSAATGGEASSAALARGSGACALGNWRGEGLGRAGDACPRDSFQSGGGNGRVPPNRLVALQPAVGEAGFPGEMPPSPFEMASVRGMALRRRHFMKSPPVSRGGFNLQAHWPAFGGRVSPAFSEGDLRIAPLHGIALPRLPLLRGMPPSTSW